jgi:hypothetical protein
MSGVHYLNIQAVAERGTLFECPLKGIDLPLVAGEARLRAQGTHKLALGSEAQTSMVGTKKVKLRSHKRYSSYYTIQDRGHFLK